MLPTITDPVRLNDLPALLGPYARTAPIYVYMLGCGNLKATRIRLQEDEDLMLVLGPRGALPPLLPQSLLPQSLLPAPTLIQ